MESLWSENAGTLNWKSKRPHLGAGRSNIILSWCVGECCANNPFKFGIQNSAGVPIIACPWVCSGYASRRSELHRQVADDSTKHELPDQNGSAGYLPGIGIGHDRLDLSLERDDFSSNRHPALSFCLSMIPAQTLRVCREGKPVPTFPDHALDDHSAPIDLSTPHIGQYET